MNAFGNGIFWTPENANERVRGEFTAEVGKAPKLNLEGRLVADPQAKTVVVLGDLASMQAAHAERTVAAFQPITVWGTLDTGQPVTLLDARQWGSSASPGYDGRAAVLGANVVADEPYSALRFHVGHFLWLAHLTAGESSVVADDQSTLGVEAAAGPTNCNWLVYASSNPATLRQLQMRVVSGCLALMHLALYPDNDLAACETQVRRDPDGPWLSLRGKAYSAEPGSFQADTLLQAQDLTISRFAEWIPLNDRLDGLAWAVAQPMNVAVQAQTQVLTSLVEGLHRRLPFEHSYFPPEVPKAALKRVRKAAWEAAAAQAREEQIDGLDPELVGELVKKAVGHVGDKSFRDRAEDVVARVHGVVPELAESVAALPARLTDPRHSFAHQLPQDEKKEPLEDRWRRWTAVSRITPWLLRALLLLNVGVDPRYLHERCLEHEKFAFFRENVAQLVRELGWDLPEDEPEPESEDGCAEITGSSRIQRLISNLPIPGSSWLARRVGAFICVDQVSGRLVSHWE
jgi:hypothetical protein